MVISTNGVTCVWFSECVIGEMNRFILWCQSPSDTVLGCVVVYIHRC